ncbi:MAG: hypothetical protein K0U74_16145 [Alphaproteobacteria bacterium]|nr:hypothetical protein [Alphaproteobacteria bacterium]
MKIRFETFVTMMSRGVARLSGLAALGVALGLLFAPSTTAMAQSEQGQISVELNKLENVDQGCRYYIVVNNQTDTEFQTLQLELVMFKTDNIIDQRIALDLAPMRKQKRMVKLFTMESIKCEDIGSILVNDALECRGNGGTTVDNCLGKLAISSRATAKFTK